MKLQLIDLLMIGAFLVAVIIIGLVSKKQAQKSKDDYRTAEDLGHGASILSVSVPPVSPGFRTKVQVRC